MGYSLQMPRTHLPAPPFVEGTTFIREQSGIHEYKLDKNGLQILLSPNATIPVAGFMVTYHVGSRNESLGYTGATHLLEHLMFKGSDNFNKENKKTVWDLLETKGALINATTWTDRTNYYSVVPKEYLGDAMALEADRMRHAHITEADRALEMTVVRNEFERGENSPMEALDKQLWALAYLAHPYHHSTIGWRSDIEQVPIERLQQFYNDFYWPDNATITVVGGFDEAETLAELVRQFGVHTARGDAYPRMYTEEPKQEGERRATIHRAGSVNMLALAHKVPEAIAADMPALILLTLILGDGKTSRLYRALVDSAKAIDVSTLCYQFRDPSLMVTYLTLAPKVKHEAVEKIVKGEYERIQKKGVTSIELARVKRNIRAAIAARRDGPYALLSALNEEIAVGDWTRFATLPHVLAAVTTRDVQRVAKKYLIDRESTVGWFIGSDE